jgi:replicative DNA helicase
MIEAGLPLSALTVPDITPEALDEYAELLNQLTEIKTKDWSLETKVIRARAVLETETHHHDTGRLVKWDDFLKEPVDPYDWVIPGLIERRDRTIVVAAEGIGKTMLARQVALCASAGTHPFTRARMPAITTLFIDLENPERIIRRTSTKIMDAIQQLRPAYDIPAHLYSKPDGLNILRQQDQTLLENLFEQTQPDLVCLGPLYKTYIDPGGRTSEAVTTEVAMYLDYLKETYNCALWLEHHAPLGQDNHRQLRPFGSSVWSRWPEFGIALKPEETVPYQYNLQHFRGARDERDWPKAITRDTFLPFASIWA